MLLSLSNKVYKFKKHANNYVHPLKHSLATLTAEAFLVSQQINAFSILQFFTTQKITLGYFF